MKTETYHIYNQSNEFEYILDVKLDKDGDPEQYVIKTSTDESLWMLEPGTELLRVTNTGHGFNVEVPDDRKDISDADFGVFEKLRIILNFDVRNDESKYKFINTKHFEET